MQIYDPKIFSVIIPTLDGTPYLKRTLDYFRHINFEGRVALSDNSSGTHRDFIASCAAAYDDVWIDTFQYAEDIRFLDKLIATLEKLDSQFVMLHAHDDFMVPASVNRCVEFLEQHKDYAAARGRVAMFGLGRGAETTSKVALSLMPHPMRSYEHDQPVERVLAHSRNYASCFYSVHRRESLIESFRTTESNTKNVIFFQYLSSCLSALQGKIRCFDELFYIRQAHGDSWSGKLKTDSYEHWPLLITSPDFSRYYQEFRAALCHEIEHRCAFPPSASGPQIDAAMVHLFRRSLTGIDVDNQEDERFFQRLQIDKSPERRTLLAVVNFAANYSDTF